MRIRGEPPENRREFMDDFDDGGVGLPDELTTALPDIEVVETEVEIDLEGGLMEPSGRTSGGARAKTPATPRKSSGGARKIAAKKPAAKKKAKPAKKAAKKAAKKSPKKAKRKAGQKK